MFLDFEISPMTDADGPEVIEIFAQSIQEGGATFRASAPSFETWSAGHLPNLRYVAKRQGEVLGFIAAAPTSQMEAYWGMIEISLYIRGNARGQGIGRALMELMKRESEHQGYWCLYSCICAENKASIALHEKCGFRLVGRREKAARDRFGKWQDTVIYEYRNAIR